MTKAKSAKSTEGKPERKTWVRFVAEKILESFVGGVLLVLILIATPLRDAVLGPITQWRLGNFPRASNFTGHWEVHLGPDTGEMYLQQTKIRISGQYRVSPQEGVISGNKDGEHFRADFLWQTQLKKWVVDGTWKEEFGSLEIHGEAVPYVSDGTNWTRDGDTLSFAAFASKF